MLIDVLTCQEEGNQTYIFSGKMPWINKNIEVAKRSFERPLRRINPDAMKL